MVWLTDFLRCVRSGARDRARTPADRLSCGTLVICWRRRAGRSRDRETPTASDRSLVAGFIVHDVERPLAVGAGAAKRRKQRTIRRRRSRRRKRVPRAYIHRLIDARHDLPVVRQAPHPRIVQRQRHVVQPKSPAHIRHDQHRLSTRPNQQHVQIIGVSVGELVQCDSDLAHYARHARHVDGRGIG